MDLPLSARVTSSAPSPASGGGLVSFSGSTAAELQRNGAQVLDAYGDPAVVPTVGGTPATVIRGMSFAASSSGTAFACELQIEPDEATISDVTPTFPIDQECPINAVSGTFDTVGFASLQFLEVTDPSELARLNNWATTFWTPERARHGVASANHTLLYEVQLAGPFNRVYVAALLWSFQELTLV